jgi:uncharacterized protein YegL
MLDILVILDRSGSMQAARADHEGGLRSFVEDQKALGSDARLTLAQFDDHNPCELVYDFAPIGDVGAIALVPRGGTPLLDAIGRATAHLEQRQAAAPSEATVVMVVTDGEENSSTEWTLARVKARIVELEAKAWRFLFLGADIDAFKEAGSLGVAHSMTMTMASGQSGSVGAAYSVTSDNMVRMRSLRSQGSPMSVASASLGYSNEQRLQVQHGTYQRPDPAAVDTWAADDQQTSAGQQAPATTTTRNVDKEQS